VANSIFNFMIEASVISEGGSSALLANPTVH